MQSSWIGCLRKWWKKLGNIQYLFPCSIWFVLHSSHLLQYSRVKNLSVADSSPLPVKETFIERSRNGGETKINCVKECTEDHTTPLPSSVLATAIIEASAEYSGKLILFEWTILYHLCLSWLKTMPYSITYTDKWFLFVLILSIPPSCFNY